jgi:hypothetical protein
VKLKFFAIVLGLILTFTLSLCKQGHKKDSVSSADLLYLNHHDSVRYMGSKSCEACHADKYHTFLETGMGKSFDVASLKKSSADFKHVVPVYDTFRNMYYFPYFSGDNYYLKEYRMDGRDTVYSRTEKISYIIGSGHHTNSHFIEENGYVFQAPITFYTQKGKWDLPPGFEHGHNTRFDRKIGLECMSCHNSIPQLVKGTDNRYEDLPHGISCERCHGPGEVHIRDREQGKTTPYTIVNPRKLKWDRQIDICQRCHLQGNAVLKPGKDFTSFRPGMVLSETFDQFSPEYEGGEDFVMAAHAERFQMSKCFISSVKGDINSETARVGFTCINCHNPHVTVRSVNSEHFNNTCRGCHEKNDQVLCSDTKAHLAAVANNCVKCHMPSSGTSDIPHVTVHDHFIRKPQPKVKNTGKLLGLRCITNKKPDILTETEAYISYFEKFDPNALYLQKAREKSQSLKAEVPDHFQTLVHLYYLTGEYAKIIQMAAQKDGSYDAWTDYRIAKAYDHENQGAQAVEWFDRVIEKEPGNLDFLLQYSVLLIRQQQYRQAEDLLVKLNKLYSKNAESWAYLGLVKLKSNEPATAKQYFQKALALDPDLLVALQNLKNLYQFLGNTEEVKKLELRIGKLNQKS